MTRKRITVTATVIMGIGMVLGFAGCPPMNNPGASWSDGTMEGINGYTEDDIQATIDINPNYGEFGTPVKVTITFSKGGHLIEAIHEYDFCEGNNFNPVYNFLMPYIQTSANVWESLDGAVLFGNVCVGRFYGIASDGSKICVGDTDVNGGGPVPDWDEDGIGTSKTNPAVEDAQYSDCVAFGLAE